MHENRLRISVCIVAYNHECYISDCLASVVSQQVDAELEILVGDDCSSDGTRKIIAGYAERYPNLFLTVFHEKNVGGSQNYHFLINKASGDYIAHLDGDDFWLPGKLAKQLAFLENNPNCSAVYSNAIVISNSGGLKASFNRVLPHQFDLNYLVRNGNFLNASSMMYRAKCKNAILHFQGDILDFQYSILLANQGPLGYINCVLVAYRINSTTSILRNRFELTTGLYWEAIMCAWALGAEQDALRHCIRGFYRSLLRTAIARRKPKDALLLYKKMVTECPLATKMLLLQSAATLPFHIGKAMLQGVARHIFKGGTEILYDR